MLLSVHIPVHNKYNCICKLLSFIYYYRSRLFYSYEKFLIRAFINAANSEFQIYQLFNKTAKLQI